jgi:ankyrin repeat protein
MIEHGADASKARNNGWAPIHMASQNGRYACVEILLDANGVYANVPVANEYGDNSAMICCQNGHVEILALLLDWGANPSIPNSRGVTAAHLACERGHLLVLQLLINSGAGICNKDKDGDTPLDLARSFKQLECIDLLLSTGATQRYVEENIWNACFLGRHEELGKIMVQVGLDINWANDFGATAAYIAAQCGHAQCLSLLIQNGADASLVMNSGWAPIHAACRNGRYACVEILLDANGVDANVPVADVCGYTSATIASQNGHVKILALLFAKGADPSMSNSYGDTAAHLASLSACNYSSSAASMSVGKMPAVRLHWTLLEGSNILSV